MGCVASRFEEEEVVSICKERKRLIKLALQRRHELEEAHCKYCRSLYAVSAAIKLFVARNSSPASPFLITFPPPSSPPPSDHENFITNPMFLQQRPSESTHEAIKCESCCSSTTSYDDIKVEEEEREERMMRSVHVQQEYVKEEAFDYFNMQMPPLMPSPSPQKDFGWDYFNLFDGVRPEVVHSYQRCPDYFNLKAVREQEGIPELEEDDREEEGKKGVMVEERNITNMENGAKDKEEIVKAADVGSNSFSNQTEQKGLTVIDNPDIGRELLDALRDIEVHFVRAYDSGKDVSMMLEANMTRLQSGMEEIKDNSTKLIQSITWHRSLSSKPSSCKSLVASSSKSSSTWTEYSNDLFDDYGGMASGSHSLTLDRLYAWEKKLYEEVKAGDSTRKIYEKKCSRLRNQDAKGHEELSKDKTRAAVKDLYARILVAIQSAETISKRVQKLRDEELQPQIIELLKGLTRTWNTMLESHEIQIKIIREVKTFACPTYGKFCNDSHRLATLQLEAELRNWRECFKGYLFAQKAYVETLHGWLQKFVVPEFESYPVGRGSRPLCLANGPPLLAISRNWLASLENLPDKGVTFALKSFSKELRALWAQQGQEQEQKRKVDNLAKDLDRKALTFQKTEIKFLELEAHTDEKTETETENENDQPEGRKDLLGMLRKKLEIEKEKHHEYMQETQRMTLSGFQTGFSVVFESMTEFSKACLKMYNDLATHSEEDRVAEKNQACVDGTKVEDDERR